MNIDIYDFVRDKCTGCGCCANACRFNAISMLPDKNGFLIPVTDARACIDCQQCTTRCPVLNYKSENNSSPKLFAARANDDIRAVSSSGGIFTVIAQRIIDDHGVVCGAAFDSNMSLKHIIVNNKKDLARLRGSKYLQSNIGTVYREIKDYLENKTKVLFTGTPCQVAALKSYLGKKYDELITIDLLCHGVPSEAIFKKYLSEKFQNKTVVDVQFRNKRFGWTSDHILIKFADGTEYNGNSKTDPYLKAFYRNLDLRESCEECPFSEFPRQGDISLGDFWGITAIDKTQNDKKGTSILYANSQKGISILKEISQDIQIMDFPFEKTVIKNRVKAFLGHNPNHYRLFKFMENNRVSFERAVDKALSSKYDIGIVSNFYAKNFGGSLTQFALYNTLEDMGYSCLMIEHPADAPASSKQEDIGRLYQEVPYKPKAMAAQYKNKEEMRALNNVCDLFIVGSDQLFQYNLYKMLGRFVTLDWVKGSKRKIAYAASFGHDHIWGDKEGLAEMSYFMKRFDAFSVREESGVRIAREDFGIDAKWVLDPVFLCDKKHYDRLIEKSSEEAPKRYIASYILDPSEEKAKILKLSETTTKMKAVVFSEFSRVGEYTEPLNKFDIRDPRVEGRLKLIKNCSFFVTDSFHGTCFAIIMNKPFVSVINNKRGGSRFISLLSKFGLSNRLLYEYDENKIKEIINTPIDYNAVNAILSNEKEQCLTWLKNAITKEKIPDYSSYDILIEKILKQENEIRDLRKMVSSLISGNGENLKHITDPVMYFNELAKMKENYIIAASVKDTPGMSVSTEVVEAMKQAGFTKSIKNCHWQSYIAVSDGGNIIYENLSQKELVYRGTVNGLNITIASRHFKAGNVSKNIINGKDYSVNRRGVNITVIDKITSDIIDTVTFDMHLKTYSCYRK